MLKNLLLRSYYSSIFLKLLYTIYIHRGWGSMRKLFTSFIFILVFFCFIPQTNAAPKASYTIFIYMNGSDLESKYKQATDDLNEMMAIGSNQNVQVVIETGGTKKWATAGISNKNNERWRVEKGKLKKIQTLSSQNMGNPTTLANFLTWGVKSYPADHYAVFFWDHGGGSLIGFGKDELFKNDGLTLKEMETAFKNSYTQTKTTFELVGFDACFMATVETASILSPYSNFLIASQEIEPVHGWDYTFILQSLTNTPKVTGEQLGILIANGYMKQAEAYRMSDQITLSVTNLAKIPNLVSEMSSFAKSADAHITTESNLNTFGKARAMSREFSESGMLDLGNFATNLKPSYATDNVLQALKNAVVYKISSPSYKDTTGLSIYFPLDNDDGALSLYKNLTFSSEYTKLLAGYYIANNGQKNISFANSISMKNGVNNKKYFQAIIANNSISRVSEVTSILGKYDKKLDRMLFLGVDNDPDFNKKTGAIKSEFTQRTAMLNKQFISMLFDYQTNDYMRYKIPAILNGNEVEIIVFYDFSYGNESADAEIIGAWSGIDADTGLADRDLVQIKKGDKLTPLYYYYDFKKDTYGYTKGKTITIAKTLSLTDEVLPSGAYMYGFYATDYVGRGTYSNFYDFTVR